MRTESGQTDNITLAMRLLGSSNIERIAGTQGATAAFWSADGRYLGFGGNGKLSVLTLATGRVQQIADAPAFRGGTFLPDGRVVFAPVERGALQVVGREGGSVTPFSSLNNAANEVAHRYPELLPDGQHLMYRVQSRDPNVQGTYVRSISSTDTRRLVGGDTRAHYVAPGYLLYVAGGTLMAQHFDLRELTVVGDPIPVARDIINNLVTANGWFDATSSMLAYRRGTGLGRHEMVWVDRLGKMLAAVPTPTGNGSSPSVDISTDGARAAIADNPPAATAAEDVWVIDLQRFLPVRVTERAYAQSPLWSPDGSRLIYFSDRDGSIYIKSSSGAGEEQRLLVAGPRQYPDGWSPDGKFAAFERRESPGNWNIYLLPITASGAGTPTPFLRSQFNVRAAQFSPDGRMFAYTSDESGSTEIYVQTYPLSTTKVRVSSHGGEFPRWRRDTRELYFIDSDGALNAADVTGTGSDVRIAVPHVLFNADFGTHNSSGQAPPYAISADGQRFLVRTNARGEAEPLTVVLNWMARLK
jgi:hypothetical protein